MNTVSVSSGAIVTPPPSTTSSSSRFWVIASTRLMTLSGSTLCTSQVKVLAKARKDGLAARTPRNLSLVRGSGKQLSSFSPHPDSERRRCASSSQVSRQPRMIERMRESSMSVPTSCGRKQALKQVSATALDARNKIAEPAATFQDTRSPGSMRETLLAMHPPFLCSCVRSEHAPEYRIDVLQMIIQIEQLFELSCT